MAQETRIPSKHLAGKFKVIGVLPGEVRFRNEIVDLRLITAEKAEELLKNGFPYLQRELKAPPVKMEDRV